MISELGWLFSSSVTMNSRLEESSSSCASRMEYGIMIHPLVWRLTVSLHAWCHASILCTVRNHCRRVNKRKLH